MSIVQTVLVFVGIPAGIVAVLALCVYGRAEMRQSNRYRPGRPWQHAPVWYLPHPDQLPEAVPQGSHAELIAPHTRPALPGASPAPTPAAVGGATGEW